MPTLAELQADFRRALLDGDERALAGLVEGGAARLDVHRNNLFASLGAALADTFPAVRRLVDPRFFAYAAHEFVRRAPPRCAVLAEYGADFAQFLAEFPPCRGLAYLPDVARLEWLLARAASAADAAPLAGEALGGIAPAETPRLVLRLHPALGFLASPWPVDRVWRANRAEGDGAPVDLGAGAVRLEIARSGSDVVMRALDAPSFAFRAALARGGTLERAALAAFTADPAFDLAAALALLFGDGAVIGVALAPAATETLP